MSHQDDSAMAETAGGEPAAEIVKNEKGQRAVVATTAISSGSIVFEEDPFIVCVNDVSEFNNCNYCLRTIQEQYEPIKKCRECNLAAFCCGECRRESKHDILECRVFQNMAEDDDFGRPHTQVGYATRMLIRIITEFGISNKEELLSFFSLCTNADSIARSDWAPHYRRRAAVVAECLADLKSIGYNTDVLDQVANVETQGDLEQLLFNMICRIHCNAYGIKNMDNLDCGNAVFLQCAGINHSCVPNCVITPRIDGIKVKAIKDIDAGAEITINYSVADNAAVRRKYLQDNYFFNCKCESCERDREWLQAQKVDVAEAVVAASSSDPPTSSMANPTSDSSLSVLPPEEPSGEKNTHQGLVAAADSVDQQQQQNGNQQQYVGVDA